MWGGRGKRREQSGLLRPLVVQRRQAQRNLLRLREAPPQYVAPSLRVTPRGSPSQGHLGRLSRFTERAMAVTRGEYQPEAQPVPHRPLIKLEKFVSNWTIHSRCPVRRPSEPIAALATPLWRYQPLPLSQNCLCPQPRPPLPGCAGPPTPLVDVASEILLLLPNILSLLNSSQWYPICSNASLL